MDLIGSVEKRAKAALGEVREKAEAEGWGVEQIEAAKATLVLNHEVTLCSAPGCLEMLFALPGYDNLGYTCAAHTPADEG